MDMTVVPLNYTCSDGLIVLHAIARSWPVQKFVIFGWINKVILKNSYIFSYMALGVTA